MNTSFRSWATIRKVFDPKNDDPIEGELAAAAFDPDRKSRAPAYLRRSQYHREREPVEELDLARLFIDLFQKRHPAAWEAINQATPMSDQRIAADIAALGPQELYRHLLRQAQQQPRPELHGPPRQPIVTVGRSLRRFVVPVTPQAGAAPKTRPM